MEKVRRGAEDECWIWVGALLKCAKNDWRGIFHLNRKRMTAHRAAYVLFKGPIPDGLLVRHTCDNGLCVNPKHLLLGTHQDNHDDMSARRRRVITRGSQRTTAKLNDSAVAEIRRLRPITTARALAEKYGVALSTIENVAKRKKWTHIP